MNSIIYPPLVEQAVTELAAGEPITAAYQAQVYRALVKDQIIDEFGNPTQQALQQGWVTEVVEKSDLTWREFIELYPVFGNFAQDFKKLDGFWEVTLEFKNFLIHELKGAAFTEIEKQQIQDFLGGRLE
ncbi:MAG: hypothetical protein ABF807_05765 [Liquorilactobacillus nagelii]|jgi:hypothetical protein|uniref:hypothetical protein n=1 Tax=Liquorilactobacillus TaxID=2767888 RepID=UPI0039E9304E